MKAYIIIGIIVSWAIRVQSQVNDFMHTDFSRADSVAALYANHSLKDLTALADKLTRPFTSEEEKFRAIYKWVCDNIDFDYGLYVAHTKGKLMNKKGAELHQWNRQFTIRMFQTLRTKRRTVCTGYAYLVKELCQLAGIRCEMIDGYGRTAESNIRGTGVANHSWNAVRLHNKWYLCDATWSCGAYNRATGQFEKRFSEAYFLPDPSLFARNHYPLDTAWMLMNKKPSLIEFLNRPLIYNQAFKYQVQNIYPEVFDVMAEKGQPVTFQWETGISEKIEQVELQVRGARLFSEPEMAESGKKNSYRITHPFSSRGTHVVHVLINSQFAFSYTVHVR
jgi:hypothetical protein